MSGNFELQTDHLGKIQVVLVAGNGEVLAASGPYPDEAAAATGIASVREIAGTGHIIDRTATSQRSAHNGQH